MHAVVETVDYSTTPKPFRYFSVTSILVNGHGVEN